MIKAVFLDVGGTLIHPNPSVGKIYSDVAERHGVCVPSEKLDESFKTTWKSQKERRSQINKSWWRDVVAGTFEGQSFKNFDAFFEDVYAIFALPDAWRIFPDVLPTLRELTSRGVRMAILSNWDERLPTLLKALSLDIYFERQFISFNLGLIKPDPMFFKRALETMNLHPLEALHVGDDLDEDVKGAEAAGMRAYLLDRQSRPLSSRFMKELSEIVVRL